MSFYFLIVIVLVTNLCNVNAYDSEEDDYEDDDPPAEDDSDHEDDDDNSSLTGYDQALIIGSRRELEELKEMDPNEAKERLGELVKLMDINKDLNIDKAELKVWIENSFKKLDDERIQEKFKELDENADGILVWPEILHRQFGYTPKEVEHYKQDLSSPDTREFLNSIKLDEFRFQLADLDRNQNLTLAEFSAYRWPQHHPHMAPYMINKTLAEYDIDKDGFLSEIELVGDVRLNYKALISVQKNFNDYDRDRNGKLDKFELVDLLQPGVEKQALTEVNHLFNATDSDRNDLLSYGEVLGQSDLWFGSHATNFGHHLDDKQLIKTEL